MKKSSLLIAPLLVVPFLVGCGGGPKEYTITWKNWDDKVLTTTKVKQDKKPEYTGETPTKPSDAQYSYTFSGWTPEVVAATCDTSYTATFTSSTNKYLVEWYNDKDAPTPLHSEELEYGATPTYHWEDKPTKQEEDRKKYEWVGEWEEEIKTVSGPAKYHAKFKETNKYQIIFQNYDGTELQNSFVEEGETPEYTGETPEKLVDGNFYIFEGWDKTIVEATEDATYTATYNTTAYVLCASFTVDTSKSKSVSFTLESGKTLNIVDWGDGTTDTSTSHTYTDTNKVYNVRVSSDSTTFKLSCSGVASVTLSDQITTIGSYAFPNTYNLTTFNVSNNIKSVAWDAFGERFDYPYAGLKFINKDPMEPDLWYFGNESNPYVVLFWDGTDDGEGEESYTINSNCSVIAGGSLNVNDNLTSIKIPNSVIAINDSAFNWDTSLKTVDLSDVDHLITGGTDMFGGCSSLEKIIVKSNLVDTYKGATGWSDYAGKIVAE